MILGSAPRPERPNRIFFESSGHSLYLESLFNGNDVKEDFWFGEGWDSGSFSYTDALHKILALFQSQPLSLKFLGLKRVFELELDVEQLPRQLQVTAEKEKRLA